MVIFDQNILFFITVFSVLMIAFFAVKCKNDISKVAVVFLGLSVYIYSGIGIANIYVSNRYIIIYFISILCLFIPFYYEKSDGIVAENGYVNRVDAFFISHSTFLSIISYLYLLFLLIPCIYPKFILFDVLSKGLVLEEIYDSLNAAAANAYIRLLDALVLLLKPLFFAFLVIEKEKRGIKKPLVLLIISLYLETAKFTYLGRYQMVLDFMMIYSLVYCIKGWKFSLSKKSIIFIITCGLISIPFMYAFVFLRQGASVESLSFSESFEALLLMEVDFPTYYDHILTSNELKEATPLSFLLWLLFLPIPSVLWPSKPSIENDLFTYSVTGLHRTDIGYYSLLPSFLGESFMFFGDIMFWVYSLVVGMIIIVILNYSKKMKTLSFFTVFIVLKLLTMGRGAATAVLPTLINGMLLIFIIDKFYLRKLKK